MELIEDKVYWSIKHSLETECYIIGAYPPRTPWKGKLYDNGRGRWQLHSFREDTGEIDHDSNAYAGVEEKDLFETYEAAKQAYLVKAKRYLDTVLNFAKEYEEFLDKFSAEASEENLYFINEPNL